MRGLCDLLTLLRPGRFPEMGKYMKPYKFGDLLYYTSPQKPRRTRCVYVREDAGKAVVLFKHAEFVARVNYVYLSSEKQEDKSRNY